MRRIIWWLRRDLRLADNLTLYQAQQDAAATFPVFVLDPHLLRSRSLAPARRQFLFDALRDLDGQLRARGGRLILRSGDPARELVGLVRETQADAVYFHRDITPYARSRDLRVTNALTAIGACVKTFHDGYLAAPEQVLKDNGEPYTVYTAYRRRFDQAVEIPARYAVRDRFDASAGIPSLSLDDMIPPRRGRYARGGESEAQRMLRAFMRRQDGLRSYGEHRNDLAVDSTSHLSPHLHLGTISVRELARAARAMRAKCGAANVDTWIGELIWREFFAQVLWHFPHAAKESFRRDYADLEWENDPAKFAAWCEGHTGYPVVDAAMRQLNATGWMHNRARMIAASFLAKDLLIDWRWGERYFMQLLIDGDLASNNGGWQWAAGTGTDAQPYFRVFNPVEQGRRFDPQGAYVRHWIPELAHLPLCRLHSPWRLPELLASGVEYPLPIVDHADRRQRALALFRRHS